MLVFRGRDKSYTRNGKHILLCNNNNSAVTKMSKKKKKNGSLMYTPDDVITYMIGIDYVIITNASQSISHVRYMPRIKRVFKSIRHFFL